MNVSRSLAFLTLAAGLILACSVSTANAQATIAPKKTFPPSVVGGKPTTLSVYNYSGEIVTPYWVDPSGAIQLVPDGQPIPPIVGQKPFAMPTFVGATLILRKASGGGVWRQQQGKNPTPFVVVGTPAKGTPVPDIVAKRLAARANRTAGNAKLPGSKARNAGGGDDDDQDGELDERTFKRLLKVAPVIVDNSETPEKGRRRGRKTTDIDVNITTPGASDEGAAPAKTSRSPSKEAAAADKSDSRGKRLLKADSPAVVEFLRIHNAARADVGASPLEWSDDLARTAQRWADHLAKTGKQQHRAETEYGELIASGGGDFTVAKAANGWLSEKADFSIDQEPKYRVTEMFQTEDGKTMAHDRDGPTAHYTQMIWGKSTMVGVGIAKTEDGKVIVVANYNPRGNVKGEKPY